MSSFLLADSFLKRDKRITLNYGDILRFSSAVAKLVFLPQSRKTIDSANGWSDWDDHSVFAGLHETKKVDGKNRLRIKTMGNDNDNCFSPT